MGYTVAATGQQVPSGGYEAAASSARDALRMFRATRRTFGGATVRDDAGQVIGVGELNRLAEKENNADRGDQWNRSRPMPKGAK
jgi:hypothetical protein